MDISVTISSESDLYVSATTEDTFDFRSSSELSVSSLSETDRLFVSFIARSSMAVVFPVATIVAPDAGKQNFRLELLPVAEDPIVPTIDISDATYGAPRWVLNDIGTFDFTLRADHPAIAQIKVPHTEVRLLCGQDVVFWGFVVRPDGDSDTVKFNCQELPWVFTKRFFGKANRTNYLQNGSFEEGFSHWAIGWNPAEDSSLRTGSAAIDPAKQITGRNSIKLTNLGPTFPKLGFFISQSTSFTVDPEVDPKGTEWTGVGWCYIDGDSWIDAGNGVGMVLTRYNPNEFVTVQTETGPLTMKRVIEQLFIPIDEDTPRDKWIRMEARFIQQPIAGQIEEVEVQYFSPHGVIWWDACQLTLREKSAWREKDQATIFAGIVAHAQDPAYNKSDVNLDVRGLPTGIVRTREYPHDEHQNIYDALQEFPALHQGMDWSLECTQTDRWIQLHYPRRGVQRSSKPIELGKNIRKVGVAVDGERSFNSVVVLGEGEGSDREEGGAQDADAFDGLILEKVFHATPGSSIASLGDQAIRAVERFKNALKILTVTVDANEFLFRVVPGDQLPVKVDLGWVVVDEYYRITSLTLNIENLELDMEVIAMSEVFV